MTQRQFIKGAWLSTLNKELSEQEFIEKAGGLEELELYRDCPYVSLVLDDAEDPRLIGHINGDTIQLTMEQHGHEKYQTMEWL